MKDSGDRFPLLLYRRAVTRHRRTALSLAVLLLSLWVLVARGFVDWPRPPAEAWLFSGGVVSLAYGLFTWIAPAFAYAQARQDHLRLQTPIYRLKVSYRRIQATRPVDLARMFPATSLRSGDRALVAPFYGRTAVGVDLKEMPLPLGLLRLFFSRPFFAPDLPGLVIMVDDWMGFSNQLTARIDAWRQERQEHPHRPGPAAGRYLGEGE
jgi:hypothetical protein